MFEKIKGKMDARRVLDGIANIGYSPHSAILDIVDNSVSACASNISVTLYERLDNPGPLTGSKSIGRILIADDGGGIDDAGAENALALGSSSSSYSPGTLSKYGLGLKSAGLSLGRRVRVWSRSLSAGDSVYEIHRDKLDQENGEWYIYRSKLTELELEEFHGLLGGSTPVNTVIEILDVSRCTDASLSTVFANLNEQVGICYRPKIEAGLKINLNIVPVKKALVSQVVQARDMLCWDARESNWDEKSHIAANPVEWMDIQHEISPNVQVRIRGVFLPMKSLSESLRAVPNQGDREKIKSMDISGKYSGAFVYRNGRLVTYGDLLHSSNENKSAVFGKNDQMVRVCIEFTDAADHAFNVDVSKQRLRISDEIVSKIRVAYQSNSGHLRELQSWCRQKMADPGSGQEDFNERAAAVTAQDPTEDAAQTSGKAPETQRRFEKLVARTETEMQAALKAFERLPEEDLKSLAITFENNQGKIRYGRVKRDAYQPLQFHDVGECVRIAEDHALHTEALQKLSASKACPNCCHARLVMEGMLWSMAAAELLTMRNLTKVSDDDLQAAFNHFRRAFSATMENFLENAQFDSDD